MGGRPLRGELQPLVERGTAEAAADALLHGGRRWPQGRIVPAHQLLVNGRVQAVAGHLVLSQDAGVVAFSVHASKGSQASDLYCIAASLYLLVPICTSPISLPPWPARSTARRRASASLRCLPGSGRHPR